MLRTSTYLDVDDFFSEFLTVQYTTLISRIRRHSKDLNWVYFKKVFVNICQSPVGKLGGKQIIVLGSICLKEDRKIAHELLHTIGFYHEHSRSDREKYVTIHPENIQKSKKLNFEIQEMSLSYGKEYDYKSIMHYPYNAFYKDPYNQVTISPNDKVGNYLKVSDFKHSAERWSQI